ncbi:MAG: hypothetical protein UU93_C0007G0042 [Candidatus Amesbacteria bacterium GW2011_GWA2_42_12]|uniref:Transcriptional modulator of MazE/toxin, MazF n=1 Tax=Candidatus Amesbacteria bacterium GW2011_GWA2_42_12 TaxID=1618356 RepID=A0A0G0Y6U1_9BACT|nr:MAG: hypothetical protein UU93_C0007G0042 [Candidatus Amesbacteria bacterium GW2011_GWA2_42_12]
MYKIFLVDFPFTENTSQKSRPVLQLSLPQGRYKIIIAAYITSREVLPLDGDVILDKLKGTGLTKKSTIRLFKLANFESSSLRGEIGVLPKDKVSEVRKKLKKILQF